MLALLNALTTFVAGNAPIGTAFPGGFHAGRAPEGTAMPYLVYSEVAAPRQTMYGGKGYGTPTLRFTAFGVGKSTVGAAIETFVAAVDEQVFTLATGQMTNTIRRQEPTSMLEGSLDQSGNEVWRWDVLYDFPIRA